MAWLELRGTTYRINFWHGGRHYSRSLKTGDETKATATKLRGEENLADIERGRLTEARKVRRSRCTRLAAALAVVPAPPRSDWLSFRLYATGAPPTDYVARGCAGNVQRKVHEREGNEGADLAAQRPAIHGEQDPVRLLAISRRPAVGGQVVQDLTGGVGPVPHADQREVLHGGVRPRQAAPMNVLGVGRLVQGYRRHIRVEANCIGEGVVPVIADQPPGKQRVEQDLGCPDRVAPTRPDPPVLHEPPPFVQRRVLVDAHQDVRQIVRREVGGHELFGPGRNVVVIDAPVPEEELVRPAQNSPGAIKEAMPLTAHNLHVPRRRQGRGIRRQRYDDGGLSDGFSRRATRGTPAQ
jgi:hypothetical protein